VATNTVDVVLSDAPVERQLAEAPPALRRILGRALDGHTVTRDEALALAHAEDGPELRALAATADALRREAVGDRVTYVVNRNINFTNICVVGCSFCGFSRGAGAPDAWNLSLDQIVTKAREAWDRGATEVCIQGGLPPGMDGYHYRDILAAIKRELPHLHIHAFSPMEIDYGVRLTDMPLGEYLLMLKEAGLGSMPGTAAEILDDEVRQVLSPRKLSVGRWVEIVRAAHAAGIPTTSTIMYGHMEELRHWVDHMLLLRDIQGDTRGITEFVPLGFIHDKTRLYKSGKARAGHKTSEDIKMHALARVVFHGSIPNIQVSWVKLGFQVSQMCLRAGANDYSGTLMEESISRLAGATYGEFVEPQEFRALIRQIGRVPAERDTAYTKFTVFERPTPDEALPPPQEACLDRKLTFAPAPTHYSGSGY
jgi:FO synthase